jgi:crossover junction endodeoxyribonuclease RuvC
MSEQTNSTTHIIGIDPGYGRLGWAMAKLQGNELTPVDLDCIETSSDQDLFERYLQMEQELEQILTKYQPDQAAIENLYFFSNQKTAMKVSESRGIVIACLMRHKLKISQYTPIQIKETVTGYGRADKKAVEKMVRMEFDLSQIQQQKSKILDDAIDALAVIQTHVIRFKNRKFYA